MIAFRPFARLLTLAALLVAPAPLRARGPTAPIETFTGRCVGVSDGDTIKVMHNGKEEKIRLHQVDAPEHDQAFGQKAKQFTSEMVFGKDVTVRVADKDRYGRTVGEVMTADGRSLNRELVKNGFAWWYRAYSKDASIGTLEAQARTAHLGLWRDPNPTPPWDFRKTTKGGASVRVPDVWPVATVTPSPTSVSPYTRSRVPEVPSYGPAQPVQILTPATTSTLSGATPPDAGLVYVTANGRRYHRQNCKSLAGSTSAHAIPRAEAEAKGIKGCAICKP